MGSDLKKKRAARKAFPGISILACTAIALTGCHGARGSAAFEIPAEFYTEKQQEITILAKNDTNKNPTDNYEKSNRDIERL